MIINPNYSINETTSTWLQIFKKFLSSRNEATKKEQTKNKEKKIKALGLELHQPKLKKNPSLFLHFLSLLGSLFLSFLTRNPFFCFLLITQKPQLSFAFLSPLPSAQFFASPFNHWKGWLFIAKLEAEGWWSEGWWSKPPITWSAGSWAV